MHAIYILCLKLNLRHAKILLKAYCEMTSLMISQPERSILALYFE